MRTFAKTLDNIRLLDELAERDTPAHRLHPLAKLITALLFLTVTVSFGKYQLSALIPMALYPLTIMIVGDISLGPILRRMLWVSPLAIGLGVFNPCFDRATMLEIAGIEISGGWVSFAVIMVKFILTVSAALMLIATTGINGLAAALRRLKVPRIFVMQLSLTYRYLALLLDEAARVMLACRLRSPFRDGIPRHAWGPLAGQLLIKTHLRAQRVYESMLCRGFNGEYHTGTDRGFSATDLMFTAGFAAWFMVVRFVNLPQLAGELLK